MAEEPVRIASVGLGRWARVLARGARRSPAIDLVGGFSRDAERRRAFQEELGLARAWSSYEELLADPEVEGVVITTPNATHRALVEQALEAGKGVFVDKPIAGTLADACAIWRAAEATGGVVAVGHSARRLSGHRIQRRWLEDGRLGEPALVAATFTNERALELDEGTWRSRPEQSPGGGLVQLGVHHFDTLAYLLGPIAAVSALVRRVHSRGEVPDLASVSLEFASGVLGSVATGWSSPGSYRVDLHGTKENLHYRLEFTAWDDSHRTEEHCVLESQAYRSHERLPVELLGSDMFREELEEFALALRGEARVEVGPAEATRALAVVFAALASSERGGALVPLAEVLEETGAGVAA